MNARKWQWRSALVAAVLASSCLPPGRTRVKTPIRVAIGMALDDPTGIAALKFRDRLNETLGDEVVVRIFPRGTLGSETAAMEGTLAGDIDVAAISNIVLANLVPELHVLDVPFGLTNADHAWRVLDGSIGEELDTKLRERGLRVMGWAYAGSRQLMFRDAAVESPTAIRGMKLRVPANPIYAETVEAWGATSTTVAWPEVYLALSQGVVDGIETAAGPSFDQKHYEVAKYLVRTDHVVYFHVWVVSERSWNAWPDAIRDRVGEAAHEAAMLNRRLRLENEKSIFRQFEQNGVTVIIPDIDAFTESVTGVVQKHSREYTELLERIVSHK